MKYLSRILYLLGIALVCTILTDAYAMKTMVLEGGRVGNGGGLVVCRNPKDQIQSVELLDYYEARTQRDFKLELSKLEGDWRSQTQQLIDRLANLSPLRQQIYSEWLKRFDHDAIFLDGVQFSTIPDSGHVAVPKGCQFEQGVIQMSPRFNLDHRYYINKALWKNMTPSQQAGLILHELIYREAIGYQHEDSISVRYLNGLIASTAFKALTLDQWVATLTQAKFEMTDYPILLENTEILLDLSQIWKSSSNEDSPIIPVLSNRIPLLLGLCNQKGCQDFDLYKIKKPYPDYGYYPLHPMTLAIRFGRFEVQTINSRSRADMLVSPISLVISNESKINAITQYQIDPLQYLPTPLQVYGEKTSVLAISISLDSIKGSLLSADSYLFANPQAEVSNGDSCQLYHLEWSNSDQLESISFNPNAQPTYGLINGKKCSGSNPSSITIREPGQSLQAVFSTNEVTKISFDETSGRYRSGGQLSAIFTGTSRQFSYRCNNIVCLKNTSALYDGKNFEISTNGFFEARDLQIALRIAPQKFELYPSGAPKSLLISESTIIQFANETRNYPAGSVISFNEDGTVKP